MKKIITVVNQKGGVGKSTIAQLLVNALRHQGNTILFIDLDLQGNLSYVLGIDKALIGSYDILMKEARAEEVILETEQGHLIPSTASLVRLDTEMQDIVGREYRLKEGLKPILNSYDYIIIDTPPTLSTTVINALTASNLVIIPTQADIYSLQGLGQLANTLDTIKLYTNPDIEVAGILITRYDSRTILTRELTEIFEHTAKELNTKVFEIKIREAIAIKEAQALRTDLLEYQPKAKVTEDVIKFIEELEL